MLITSSAAEAASSTIAGVSGTWLGMWAREVDPAGDDQRQRGHPELGDGRVLRLAHELAILVMMISVAICIAPRTPAE